MASSSSSSHRTWRYRVFASFHGPDVRKTFLSHLRKQFCCNGISMFDDQGIERSYTIAPALKQAISESRISIVVLSKSYASSSWCLDELLGILKCKEEIGQIVMTVFYGVDPSDVRKQTGEFGKVFKETCRRKTEEERRRWSQALTDVGNIAGEHFLNWDNESKMIEKISRDVSNKLNATISKDFEDMVGLEAHLEKMQSLLHLDDEDEAMIVGICGPAGIGKTTILELYIAGSLVVFSILVLWRILREDTIAVLTSAIQERLCDLKVLIVLDDVVDLKQLEALADETSWFGLGSRIIVTTEDQELLEQHGINNTYHVDFPNEEEARKICCRYAFRQSSAPNGFEKLVERVTVLCSNLPLGLSVMGSSLRRKSEDDWESILRRLENSLDGKIDGVLRVGYENLHKDDQFLFLLIACFLNYQDDDRVNSMLGDSNLDVRLGLKTLAYKSLIQISAEGTISMHKLLQQVAREAVQIQEPSKRQILIDIDGIRDALETDSVSTNLIGISLDVSTIPNVVSIRAGALKRMLDLRFLSVYETRRDVNVRVHVPEDMDFPPRLRLLRWEVYPGKCLPFTFTPEHLVELNLVNSKLEKLWQGTQPLTNLKKMDLSGSMRLKEVPDLSNATNLKKLNLTGCWGLVEIPSSVGDLHKLEELEMNMCISLQVVPANLNLASLKSVKMVGCWQMRKIPDISTNIDSLVIGDTMLEEFPESITLWPRLQSLNIYGSLISAPFLAGLNQSHISLSTIERIPDCIKDLDGLKFLYIAKCPKLASLPELPRSLRKLTVENCESLETVCFPCDTVTHFLYFPNCFKLGPEARRVIIKQSFRAYLPGREIPEEFNHRAIGSCMTIRPSICKFKICLVLSPKPDMEEAHFRVLFHIRGKGCTSDEFMLELILPKIRDEHLCVFFAEFVEQHEEVLFKFSTPSSHEVDVSECGVQVLTDDETNTSIRSCDESCTEQVSGDGHDESLSDKSNEFGENRVKVFKGYTLFLALVFTFILSSISSVLLYSFGRQIKT
ncbi:unnamed protein product [Microthlaspi erraticum]|uniref:ADP-ribosyl cyclase/cyclic ADP-ribose hydrolase n=1 Tax=Microthlaspi erraticum TaxID=1685480 RepID=A0A6D2KKX2_9BRAS|nr:unnamed protein product [Microthlaspi erraticum]